MTAARRTARVERKTAETVIEASIDLDGSGLFRGESGIGFFDHMLAAFAKHAMIDIQMVIQGDLHVDGHHTVEDTGIVLGRALRDALGDCAGITRFGHSLLPMDEALAEAAVDVSGRPFLVFDAALSSEKVGAFDVSLTEEFFRAFATNAAITLHLTLRRGANAHHQIEALFKATARALRAAMASDPRETGVPSTKGGLVV